MLHFHQSLSFLNSFVPLHHSPSKTPSKNPSNSPSKNPSKNPSKTPSKNPSKTPSKNPEQKPEQFPDQLPDWLAPHHPILNATFPPITVLLNRPTYHKVPRAPHHPFPKLCGPPNSMNKLTLTSQQQDHKAPCVNYH